MLQLSLYNENHEFVQLNELKTRFLKDSYCERPCNYAVEMYLLTQNINIFDYYEASHLSEVQFIILLPVQFPLSICLSSG